MSNIYNFYIGGEKPKVGKSKNKKNDNSHLLGEIEELKNELTILKQEKDKVLEEYQNFRYEVYAELTALTLSHNGRLKLNNSIFEFTLSHPDKVSLQFVNKPDGKEYLAKMEEVVENNAN